MRCQRCWHQALAIAGVFAAAAAAGPPSEIRRSAETDAALRYRLSDDDERLLNEIEHACFQFFWKEVGAPAPLVKDRYKGPVSSIAAVGFQLSALPVGVERGWVTRAQAEERALAILDALLGHRDNKRFGVYLHYPDLNTGGLSQEGYEIVASTVDHALLVAGAMPAAVYFRGRVAERTDQLVADTNWKAFATGPSGLLSMGWRPKDSKKIDGPGDFLDWHWWNASDEERLVYFLAAAAPRAEHAVEPALYYRLKRSIEAHDKLPPFVVSWPGTLFTYFFSHCWIDYRTLGLDDPARFGVDAPRVDWVENSRRAVLTHRQRCIDLSTRFKTLAPDRWGLSACAARDGYIVPQLQPNLTDKDELHEGTVAPYAAGSAIMFAPREAVAALRVFRELKGHDGKPLIWRDPAAGGYGLVDSFNLDQHFASDDYVGIDHGPLLLAIENARTGLIWRLFMQHENARRAVERLRLQPHAEP